jgi:hypothetical protein
MTASFEGVLFRVQFPHGQQVACDPICQNCGHPLDKQSIAGAEPMLVCLTKNEGCTTLIKKRKKKMGQFLTNVSR